MAEDGRACFSLSIQDDNVYLPDLRIIELSFSMTYPTDMIDGPNVVTVRIEDDGKYTQLVC